MVPHNNYISLVEGASIVDIVEVRKQDLHIPWNEYSGEELGTTYRGDQEYGRGRYHARDHGKGGLESNFVES